MALASPTAMAAETPSLAPSLQQSAAIKQLLARLARQETGLLDARAIALDCGDGCLTPAEAAALAYSLSAGGEEQGRFILDIKSGGRSLQGSLGRLFFVNSHPDYAEFGTLTIAFEDEALEDLLSRPQVCGAREFQRGRINVKACRDNAQFDLNIFTMMRRLINKRIVVDGAVSLQWIDARFGARMREGAKQGYYQVYIKVASADQVAFVPLP